VPEDPVEDVQPLLALVLFGDVPQADEPSRNHAAVAVQPRDPYVVVPNAPAQVEFGRCLVGAVCEGVAQSRQFRRDAPSDHLGSVAVEQGRGCRVRVHDVPVVVDDEDTVIEVAQHRFPADFADRGRQAEQIHPEHHPRQDDPGDDIAKCRRIGRRRHEPEGVQRVPDHREGDRPQ
jgi:hypothetical protein